MLLSLFTCYQFIYSRAHEQVIESFSGDDYIVNTPIPSGKSATWKQVSNHSNQEQSAIVKEDQDDIFELGSGNQIGYFSDLLANSESPLERLSLPPTTSGVLSFDFVVPGESSPTNWIIRLSAGGASNSRTLYAAIFLAKENAGIVAPAQGPHINPPATADIKGSYPFNKKNNLKIVFNNNDSESPITYRDTTVSPDHMSLWLNDELIATNVPSNNPDSGKAIKELNMTLKSGSSGTILMDNITIKKL